MNNTKKKSYAIILLSLFVFSLISPSFISAQEEQALNNKKPFLGVLDLDCTGDPDNSQCYVLSDTLRERFLKTGVYRLVDRKNMNKILSEQAFQLSDCTTESCAVEVGRLLGVEKMVFGSIGRLGEEYVITVQIVDVESGEIEKIKSHRFIGSVSDLMYPLNEIAFEIANVPLIQIPKAKRPWYKKPWVWAVIAGAVGSGAYATYALAGNGDGDDQVELIYRW